jgi:DNA polymerase-3 subunit delta
VSVIEPLVAAASASSGAVLCVVGDAGPLVDEAAEQLVSVARSRLRMPAFNHATYGVTDDALDAALSAARTPPMMDAVRLVVVRDLREASPAGMARLVAYAQAPPATTVLIAIGTGLPKADPKGGAWGKQLARAGALVATLDAKDVAPIPFVRARAARLGRPLSEEAARRLVAIAGEDPGVLVREVEKLALYVGEASEIDVLAVEAATSQLAEAVVWDLTSGVAAQHPDRALTALHRLLEDGSDPRQLLGMLAWQWRDLLRYADRVRQGLRDDQIRDIRLRPELQRAVRTRVGRHFPGAAAVMSRLGTAWREMNGHRAGDRAILEALVLELLR